MIIVTDKGNLHIGWRFIWAWPKAARAARRLHPVGIVYILGIPVWRW